MDAHIELVLTAGESSGWQAGPTSSFPRTEFAQRIFTITRRRSPFFAEYTMELRSTVRPAWQPQWVSRWKLNVRRRHRATAKASAVAATMLRERTCCQSMPGR